MSDLSCGQQSAIGQRGSLHTPEAPFPSAELLLRGIEISLIKLGPHAIGKQKFRVGRFPEQEVRQSLLSASADQQIHKFGLERLKN